jgi:2-dehydro-3-deoxyphosphogluconate aldolase/(4S)-4-hydroxy-2-oxoglutarate aldolase
MDVMKQLGNAGLLPVIKIDKVEDAVPLAQALLAGGLPVAEITFRTATAPAAMEAISKALPNMLMGAGTVLTCDQVDQAIDVGAKYLVSPGFNPKVVEHAQKRNIPMTPGVITPSEAEQAAAMGLKILKFFPAEQAGGVAMIKTFYTVYPHLKFIPTGGVSIKNMSNYVRQPNIHAVGGTWMVGADLINAKAWGKIEQLADEAVVALHDFSLAHVGINLADAPAAQRMAAKLNSLFGYKTEEGNSSIFMTNGLGKEFELMKSPYMGDHGHIAIRCNNVDRGEAYLHKLGLTPKESTRKKATDGSTQVVYFNELMGGFAFHLTKYAN